MAEATITSYRDSSDQNGLSTDPEFDDNLLCNVCANENKPVVLDADFVLKLCYLVIGIFGMAGNLVVIIIMLRFKHLRKTVTNQIIINQSVIDFLASFFIISSSFLRRMPRVESSLLRNILCRVWLTNLPMWAAFACSTYNVVLMTLEKYLAIVHPLQPGLRISHRKAYILMVAIWIFGFTYKASFTIPLSGVNSQGECTVYSEWPSSLVQKVCGVLFFVVQFFLPLLINTLANIHMAVVLKRQSSTFNSKVTSDVWKENMSRAQRNSLKMLILVFITDVACWTWSEVYFLLFNLGYGGIDFTSGFYHFTVIAGFCNCCLNPIVYVMKYKPFQEAAKQMVLCTSNGQSQESGSSGSGSQTDIQTGANGSTNAETSTQDI